VSGRSAVPFGLRFDPVVGDGGVHKPAGVATNAPGKNITVTHNTASAKPRASMKVPGALRA
jgi:hypothetical protein